MIPLTNPSHGGTYVVEGRFSLGSDWLIVVPQALPPVYLHTTPRIVTVRRILSVSRVSGFGVALTSLIVVIMVCCVSQCLLTWYLVSHDGLTISTDLPPCLLMLQGVLSRSIPHSCCTRIAVLTLVDDHWDS